MNRVIIVHSCVDTCMHVYVHVAFVTFSLFLRERHMLMFAHTTQDHAHHDLAMDAGTALLHHSQLQARECMLQCTCVDTIEDGLV
jgi:hypothetical protein